MLSHCLYSLLNFLSEFLGLLVQRRSFVNTYALLLFDDFNEFGEELFAALDWIEFLHQNSGFRGFFLQKVVQIEVDGVVCQRNELTLLDFQG